MMDPQEVIEGILKDMQMDGELPDPPVDPDLTPPPVDDPQQTPESSPQGDQEPPVTPPEDDLPPVPPGGAIWEEEPSTPPEPPQVIRLSDGTELTLAEVEQLIHARPTAPPSQPTFPPQPPTLPSPPDLTPPQLLLPQFTEDDLENPAVRAIVMIAAQQAQRQQQFDEELKTLREQTQFVQHRDNAEIANSAMTAFQSEHNLPADLMSKIEQEAANELPLIAARMQAEGEFDPYKAVTTSLTRGYWLVPEARQFEFQRQTSHRQAALERQRKLNGVGGSSGSAPHTAPPPDTSTREGLYQSMVAEVSEAMGMSEE